MWGQLEDSHTTHFHKLFHVYSVMGVPEKVLICCGKTCGAKIGAKPSVVAGCVALRRSFFTLAWAKCGPEFTSRGRRVETSQHLKRTTEIF
jgi:hypothetical protein